MEGDSATTIAWLARESGSLMPSLRQARTRLSTRGDYQLLLTPRDANSLADRLAKFGKNCNVKHVWRWDSPPPQGLIPDLDSSSFVSCSDLALPNNN